MAEMSDQDVGLDREPYTESPEFRRTLSDLGALTQRGRLRPNVSAPSAFAEGVLSGASANFRDELYGVAEASGLPPVLGGFRIPVGAARLGYEWLTDKPGEATERYTKGRDVVREVQKVGEEEYPLTTLAGNVAGGLSLPMGGAAQGATLPARMARSGTLGLGYGAAYGAGAGEDASSRLTGAAASGAIGGVLGGLAPAAIEGASGLAGLARDKFGRVLGPVIGEGGREAEAERRLALHLRRDYETQGGKFGLTPEEAAIAEQGHQPLAVVDLGGESTRALARSAANTSPMARQIMHDFFEPRFESQGVRAAEFLKTLVPTRGNAAETSEAIRRAGTNMNNQLYTASRQEFANGIPWTTELAEVAMTPAVTDAMRAASRSIQNRVGSGASQPAIVGADNRLTLEAWDIVKRNLDGRIGEARNSGNKTLVNELMGVRRALVNQLDQATINPETGISSYQVARGAAAEVFGALDAVEAGQKFVNKTMPIHEARRAVAKMSPEEQTAFAEGYVSELANKFHELGYRRSILVPYLNSPAALQRAEIALGPEGAKQLQTFFRVEAVMDRFRQAITGNSKTAQYLAELGLASGSGLGYGATTGDFSPTGLLTGALLFKGLKEGAKYSINKADNKIAIRVAEMLTSNDPEIFRKGILTLSQQPRLADNLRRAEAHLGPAAVQAASSSSKKE